MRGMNGHAARLRSARKRVDGRRRRQRGFPGLASSVHHLLVVGRDSLWRSSALCASPASRATLRAPISIRKAGPSDEHPRLAFPRPRRARGSPRRLRQQGRFQPRHGQRAHGWWWRERHLGRQLPERGRELPRPAVVERPRRAVARRRHLHADVLQGRRGGDEGGGSKKNKKFTAVVENGVVDFRGNPTIYAGAPPAKISQVELNAIKRCIDKAKSG